MEDPRARLLDAISISCAGGLCRDSIKTEDGVIASVPHTKRVTHDALRNICQWRFGPKMDNREIMRDVVMSGDEDTLLLRVTDRIDQAHELAATANRAARQRGPVITGLKVPVSLEHPQAKTLAFAAQDLVCGFFCDEGRFAADLRVVVVNDDRITRVRMRCALLKGARVSFADLEAYKSAHSRCAELYVGVVDVAPQEKASATAVTAAAASASARPAKREREGALEGEGESEDFTTARACDWRVCITAEFDVYRESMTSGSASSFSLSGGGADGRRSLLRAAKKRTSDDAFF